MIGLCRVLFWLWLVLPWAAQAGARTELALHLRAQATVASGTLRLGDVADWQGGNALTSEQFAALTLGPAPLFKDSRVYSRTALAQRIRVRVPGLQSLRWAGADVVRVERAAQDLQPVALQQAAATELAAWLATWPLLRVQWDLQQVPLPLPSLPAGALSVAARPLGRDQIPAGLVRLQVDVKVEDVIVLTLPMTARVHATTLRSVAQRPLEAGERLAGEDLRHEERSLEPGGAFPVQPSAVRAVLRHRVQPGQVVDEKDVLVTTDVEPGQQVQVRLRAGLVQVQTTARAMDAVNVGQRLRVVLAGSRVPLGARLMEAGVVEVME